jgi:hypothetical protein
MRPNLLPQQTIKARWLKRGGAVVLFTSTLVIGVAALPTTQRFLSHGQLALEVPHLPGANAQRVRANEVWQQVYQLLPSLPQENQYVSRRTGEVATNNTLVGRLIRYHVYVVARPTTYRLDWKLTLADYLGANQAINADTYPGADSLRENPLPGDVAVIQRLTRPEREALVQALVTVFTQGETPDSTPATPAPAATPALPATSSPVPQPAPARPPQPGDAQLLIP